MITNFQTRRTYQVLAVIVGTLIYGIGVTTFLRPMGIMPGGLAGISQLINLALPEGNKIPSGIILVILNVPLLIFGWTRVSHRFTYLSIIAILITMTAFDHIHITSPISDRYLSIICGSILAGFGMGLALRFGGSLGGTDVIANYLSIKQGRSIATFSMSINAIVVIFSGLLQHSFEKALMTFISMFIVMEVINFVHTRHEKMMFIVITSHEDVIVPILLNKIKRGITLIDGVGAYSSEEKKVVMMTVSSYQIYQTQQIIHEYDNNAFVNVLPVKSVSGNFKASIYY